MSTQSVREKLEQRLAAAQAPAARHVFTAMMTETARAEADACDARRRAGISLGPLDGCIVSIKDLFDVAGTTTLAGSKLRRRCQPAVTDAPAVARLRRAGAVLIGRTNMTEFAFSGLGLNPHWGTPGNASSPDRIPGGSTSGGAVSVALGIADLALGSDTGGSTRIPAAFNGIVGFKPTSPRVPTVGAYPLSHTLDSIGPMGADVAVCAAADAVLAGEEPAAMTAAPLASLRIGVPRGIALSETEWVVSAAFERAVARLEAGGCHIAQFELDDVIANMRATNAAAPIVACEAAAIHAGALSTDADGFDPRVLARIRVGSTVPAPAYVATLRRREDTRRSFAARMESVDAVALPTVPICAPLLAPLEADDALFTATNLLVLRNTSIANFCDVPALSLPLPVDGLPVGLMLLGRPMQDRRLMAIGASVERLLADRAG